MKTILTVEVRYHPRCTDPEGLAVAMDRLLETALSTPGIMEEYGNPTFDDFFVAEPTSKDNSAPPCVVLNISGGVLQEVFSDNSRAKIVKVDWDTEGCSPNEKALSKSSTVAANPSWSPWPNSPRCRWKIWPKPTRLPPWRRQASH